jgi:ketosteroid isomerase-like protein
MTSSTSASPNGETPYYSSDHQLSDTDVLALQQVIARLNHALDEADYAAYGQFFASDGVFVSDFGNAVGPTEVAAALEQVAPFITNKRHVASNLVVNGSGDEAIVTSYLIVFERLSELKYVGSAVNQDTMRKMGGRWLVTKHESTLDPATASYIAAEMAKAG